MVESDSIENRQAERWLPVVGYEGYYEVSDCGGVRSVTRKVLGSRNGGYKVRKGAIMRATVQPNGYRMVCLHKDAKAKGRTVHRMVAESFIPNPENKPQVNHKNGVKTDNWAENLEWVTGSENSLHAYRTGLQTAAGSANGQAKLTEADIPAIRRRLASGEKATVVAKSYGVHRRTVWDAGHGRTWAFVPDEGGNIPAPTN